MKITNVQRPLYIITTVKYGAEVTNENEKHNSIRKHILVVRYDIL